MDVLIDQGRAAEAWRELNDGRASRDPEAVFLLACWRVAGHLVRRDLTAARGLFGEAAALGHREAAEAQMAMLAAGAGGPRDFPAACDLLERTDGSDGRHQRALLRAMALSPAGDPLAVAVPEILSTAPFVACARGLLTPSECAYLVAQATPWLAPAHVVDPQTGRLVRNPVRTSDGMAFAMIHESPVIHAVNRRIAALSGQPAAHGEPLQVLRYQPGQEYRPHSDAIPGAGNQRILTVLVYLNEGYQGGATQFPRIGLSFSGQVGDALLFANVSEDGRPDPLAEHAGEPVSRGEKFIATRWIRARPFEGPRPRPLLDV